MTTFIIDYQENYVLEIEAKTKDEAIEKVSEEMENNSDKYFDGGELLSIKEL